jgi:hypothetical protein
LSPFFNTKLYNREKAVNYAIQWALQRNPQYYDYSSQGGDCTNFASQVIYSGAGVMNYNPIYGWYYKNGNEKSPSWTGVDYLYNFLVTNTSRGPFAEAVSMTDLQLGDLIQISFVGNKHFNHSLPVTKLDLPIYPDHIYTSTHTPNALNRKLSTYTWVDIRFLHIKGVNV